MSASCARRKAACLPRRPQLGFGLRDIFLARPGHSQIKRLLIYIQLGFGYIQRRLRVVEVLLGSRLH